MWEPLVLPHLPGPPTATLQNMSTYVSILAGSFGYSFSCWVVAREFLFFGGKEYFFLFH